MNDSDTNEYTCSQCNFDVNETDNFCPNCGSLFDEEFFCKQHPEQKADGVCIICAEPHCIECGSWVNDLFLCGDHDDYEIFEGKAKIFGVGDESLAQYAQGCLEEAGLNPFLFFRRAGARGSGVSLFHTTGAHAGHNINEIKILVPCNEVIQAEQVLVDLDILS